MSGLLVLFACLAVAVAIGVPTVVRASGSPSKPPVTSRIAAETVHLYLKLDGLISFKNAGGMSDFKFPPAECRNLIVAAHSGSDASGPIIARTNAMTGNEPGTCVYSLKVPADQNITVGVESFSLRPQKSSTDKYLKLGIKAESSFLKLNYKEHRGQEQLNLPIYVTLKPGQ